MDINDQVIRSLVEIGGDPNLESARTTEVLEGLGQFDRINRLHWRSWKPIAEQMAREDLMNLIRGLTLAEKHHRWIGGSVAAVIWVFQVFQVRFPAEAETVADWVLRNSTNPWVPFGRAYYGPRDLASFTRDQESRRAEKSRKLDEQKQDREKRENEKQEAANRHQAVKENRDAERESFLREFAALSPVTRVERLADETLSLPIDAIPRDLIPDDDEALRKIERAARTALIEKINKRGGGWGKLKKRLVDIDASKTGENSS